MMLAVGGHYLGEDRASDHLPLATGFSGGYGDSRAELCGALSGGAMVIGAVLGRTCLGDDDSGAIRVTAEYRKRFVETLADSNCGVLRESVEVPGGPGSCTGIVSQAAKILVDLMDEVT
jgi:C_GCAxxG_C_C family probable redox protein